MKCPSCGASLSDEQPGGSTVECGYCGSRFRAPAPAPPRPQPVRTEVRARVRTATRKASGGGCLVGCFVLLMVGAGTLIPLGLAFRGPVEGWIRNNFVGWEFPVKCGVNEHLTIDGQTATLPGRTLIEAETNCEVTIRNSVLSGRHVVTGTANVEVFVENSRLHGEESAIALEVNGAVELAHSTVTGERHAVRGGANLDLSARRSWLAAVREAVRASSGEAVFTDQTVVRGGEVGVLGDNHVSVRLNHSTIEAGTTELPDEARPVVQLPAVDAQAGDTAALRGQHHMKLRGEGGTVSASGHAIDLGSHARVELEGTTVSGAFAFELGGHGSVRLRRSRLTGERIHDRYTTIDERDPVSDDGGALRSGSESVLDRKR